MAQCCVGGGPQSERSGEVSCANLLDGFPLAGPSLGFTSPASRTPTGTVTTGAFHSEFPGTLFRCHLGGIARNWTGVLAPTEWKEGFESFMSLESFISEHTAEYILVPNIVRRLTQKFNQVIPVFLWLTREGNTTALEMMDGKQIRLLTAFPRRPKVLSPNGIAMTLNHELIAYSERSEAAGMVVLVGVPLISSLPTLRIDAHCCWFELNGRAATKGYFLVEIGLDGNVISNHAPARALSGPLTDAGIEDAADRCRVMPWREAVEKIREIRSIESEVHGFPFFGGYKPFHLMLLEPRVR